MLLDLTMEFTEFQESDFIRLNYNRWVAERQWGSSCGAYRISLLPNGRFVKSWRSRNVFGELGRDWNTGGVRYESFDNAIIGCQNWDRAHNQKRGN